MSEVIKGNEIHLALDLADKIKEPLRTPRRLDQALGQLTSARGRIFHAMFWFVDATKIDHGAIYYLTQGQRENAVKMLQSQANFSSYINLAVLALIEERYDDAATLYSRCLQDEEMTQAFVHSIIGDKFKVKGAFVLSRVLDVLNKEKEHKEQYDNSDERSFAGAGSGVRNKETQVPRPRLRLETPRSSLLETLNLKKQAGSFDRHLNESLNNLIERIEDINRESGIEDDFIEVELNPNPAALQILNEIAHFLAVNHSLMEAFRARCFEARERSLYLDYVYNLISVVNYAVHLYAIELGRQYSPTIVQQLRSIIAKLERLYFRLKSDDLDCFIASLRRIEDALPYYYAIANNFEKYYLLSDDKQMIPNFYEFYKTATRIVNKFNLNLGLKGDYTDCGLHLQDMVVRYTVSFMLVLVNLALRNHLRPKINQESNASLLEVNVNEAALNPYGDEEQASQGTALEAASEGDTTGVTNSNSASGNGPESAKPPKLTKEQKKQLKEQERERLRLERKRSAYFKRKLGKQRKEFISILERYENYFLSQPSKTLLEVTMRQVKRLPPPVSFKGVLLSLLLIAAAAGAVYLNIIMGVI